jgi:hypothetical protein
MSLETLPENCYSLRLLSPFRGVLQLVETPDAQAVSIDGVHWRIQVRAAIAKQRRGMLDSEDVTNRPVAYGSWSRKGGLRRAPVNPSAKLDDIRQRAEALLSALLAYHNRVPFDTRDHAELWLLDEANRQPLALLASARDPGELPQPKSIKWQPTAHGDLSFTSSSLAGGNAARLTKATPYHRDVVAALVNKAAGHRPGAQWFWRDESGSGRGLTGWHLEPGLEGRALPPKAFPELLVRELWDDPVDQQLMSDFIDWQAPLLLTQPHISTPARDRLERAARKAPLQIYALYHVYPTVTNRDLINAALVEAEIRRSAGS